jgi:hypothetical protein
MIMSMSNGNEKYMDAPSVGPHTARAIQTPPLPLSELAAYAGTARALLAAVEHGELEVTPGQYGALRGSLTLAEALLSADVTEPTP